MTFEPHVADRMRRLFRAGNHAMVMMFRLGLGPWFLIWPRVTGRVLVVEHRGRTSGRRYRTPLNYAEVDGRLYVTAGFGPRTDWYRNVRHNPEVDVWLPDGWWSCRARDVSNDPDRWEILRAVLVGSGFAAYLFGVDPAMPEDRLEATCADYRLVCLDRVAPRTGRGGPGDLAWIWPLLWIVGRRRAR